MPTHSERFKLKLTVEGDAQGRKSGEAHWMTGLRKKNRNPIKSIKKNREHVHIVFER